MAERTKILTTPVPVDLHARIHELAKGKGQAVRPFTAKLLAFVIEEIEAERVDVLETTIERAHD